MKQVVYWWAIKPETDGSHRMGVNTRNMNPKDLVLVERRIQFDANVIPLGNPALRHRDDIAEYA